MTIALVSSAAPADTDHDEQLFVQRSAEVASSTSAGVVDGRVYLRRSPDTQPFAGSLGGRYLAMYDLAGDTERPDALLSQLAASTGGWALGSFERLTEYQRTDGDAGSSTAGGILVILLNNTDPHREEAFNEWYDRTHLLDVVQAADFWRGVRYKNSAPEIAEGSARYLAIYRTERDDVVAAQAALLEGSSDMTLWPHIEQVHVAAYVETTS